MSSISSTDIQITQTGEKPGEKNFSIEIPLEQVEKAEHKAASEYAKQVKLPGFRKGKTPLAVVKKKFGSAIREGVVQEAVRDAWQVLLEQEKLDPIADPIVEELKFDEGEPLIFKLMVAVKPELTLDRIGGFSLTRKMVAVTDEMTDAQVEQIRKQQAPWVPSEEGAKPQVGELVSITMTPLDEESDVEGKQYQVVIGEGQALPDVEEQLKSMAPGDIAETSIVVPNSNAPEGEEETKRSVRIELHEVKHQDLPELDDEFAKQVGEFESLDALREAVRSDIEGQITRDADTKVRQQLVDEIIGANSFDAPRPMVQRMMAGLAQNYQIPDEQLEKFAAEMTPIAEQQVKRNLIIEHVAETADLKATEEDVDDRIEKIANSRGVPAAQIYSQFQKANQLNDLERGITEEKVFEHLLGLSTVTDETA